MINEISFIGRVRELAQIELLINEWDTQKIVGVRAEGGIGKTRFLQELYKKYSNQSDKIFIANIIDFDDQTFHIADNIEHKIAELIGEKVFRDYLEFFQDYRQNEMTSSDPERLAKMRQEVHQNFIDNYNQYTSKRRVVLFFDTLDAIPDKDISKYIVTQLCSKFKNTLIIIAGRPEPESVIWSFLEKELEMDFQYIKLAPLKKDESKIYIQNKKKQMSISKMDEKMAEKLQLLSMGRPILINLAVERWARGINLEWLVKSSLEEIKKYSEFELKERRKEFERLLVQHIYKTLTPIDKLTLAMSHVYPLKPESIAIILEFSDNETTAIEKAEELFKEAKAYVFIKSRPDGTISLHDEMRRMINDYVWPEFDPTKARRRWYSVQTAKFLEQEIKTLKEKIDKLKEKEKIARINRDKEAEMKAFKEQEALERELWVLEPQRLNHTLFYDVNEGVKLFTKLFDEAKKTYRRSSLEPLLIQIRRFKNQFSIEQQYEIDIRETKFLFEYNKYKEAKEILNEILNRKLSPEQKIDVLDQLAHTEIRLGRSDEAIKLFKRAVRISEKHKKLEKLAVVETSLGWANRKIGRLEEAREHYNKVLKLTEKIGDKDTEAWARNELIWIFSRQGEHGLAREMFDKTESLWREVDNNEGLGAYFKVKGEFFTESNEFDKAIESYQEALKIFEPENDFRWLSGIYSRLGKVYRLKGELDFAENYLLKALDIGLPYDIPQALHYLGQVYRHRKNFDKAEECFEKSRREAEKINDGYYQMENLSFLAQIALLENKYNKYNEYVKLYRRYRVNVHEILEKFNIEYQYPRAEGIYLNHLGHLALKYNPQNMNLAIEHYCEGFPLIAVFGTYEPYTFKTQFGEMIKYVKSLKLSKVELDKFKESLSKKLQEKKFDVDHPDEWLKILKWINEENINEQ